MNFPSVKPKSNRRFGMKELIGHATKVSEAEKMNTWMAKQDEMMNAWKEKTDISNQNTKEQIDYRNESAVNQGKYTNDETRSIGMSESIQNHINYIRQEMKNDPEFESNFKSATARIGSNKKGSIFNIIPTTMGNKKAMVLNQKIKDMDDRILRLRSGAQINAQELDRLSGLTPSWIDLSDPSDINYTVLNDKLNSFEVELSNVKNRLMNGRSFDDTGKPMVYDPNIWGDSPTSTKSIPGVSNNSVGQSSQNDDMQKLLEEFGGV